MSLEKAFDRVEELARQSGNNHNYMMAAMLLGPDGAMINERHNDVLTGEPHGVQAEVHLLQDYFKAKAAGESQPKLEDCTMVTFAEPGVAAGQIIEANVGKVYHGLPDPFVSLTNPKNWPRKQRAQVRDTFEQLAIEPDRLEALQQEKEEVDEKVRQHKKETRRQVTEDWPPDHDHLPDRFSYDDQLRIFGYNNPHYKALKATFEDDYALVPDFGHNHTLMLLLLDTAAQSKQDGHAYNAAFLCDKAGNLLDVFGDESKDNPLKTPIMRAVDAAHDWGYQAGMQGNPELSEDLRRSIPHMGELVCISLNEPNMMEFTCLSQPNNRSTVFIKPNRDLGMRTTGHDKNMPPYYEQVKNAGEMLHYAGRQMEALVPTGRER